MKLHSKILCTGIVILIALTVLGSLLHFGYQYLLRQHEGTTITVINDSGDLVDGVEIALGDARYALGLLNNHQSKTVRVFPHEANQLKFHLTWGDRNGRSLRSEEFTIKQNDRVKTTITKAMAFNHRGG